MALDLLDNIPVENLTEQTDFFGHLNKAQALKEFLKTNIDSFKKNKMLALYGEWGSGKSTILKYLEKELKTCNYVPIFFEAWQYEKDDNLALSLIDKIKESFKYAGLKKEIIETSSSLLKAFTKGITIKTPFFDYDYSKVIESTEKDYKERAEGYSFHSNLEKFKKTLEKIEDQILEEKAGKKIIVFIDDLDRCEPENVLNLISAIKLFFTYGNKIIFMFGIDKKAVSQAVEVRYGKTIQSEVYLEKVFDITFNMPKEFHLRKLLAHYFPQTILIDSNSYYAAMQIEIFLNQIEFTIPRHLKKVLNKYAILQSFNINIARGTSGDYLVPTECLKFYNKQGNENELIQTIFVLYFIILYEFYPHKFKEIENYEEKISFYAKSHRLGHNSDYGSNSATVKDYQLSLGQTKGVVYVNNLREVSLSTLCESINPNTAPKDAERYKKMLTIFTPLNIENYNFTIPSVDYLKQFENSNDKILIGFCQYLDKHKSLVFKMNDRYKFWNLFEMAKTLL
jgi:hypothetical protein